MKCSFGIACFIYWHVLTQSSYPPTDSLARVKQAYAAKLAYKDNARTLDEFAIASELGKSRIPDFTNPKTGLNPYLDIPEGSTGDRQTIYKHDRHSKRDNEGPNEDVQPSYERLIMMEKNPLLNRRASKEKDGEGWDMEAKDEPTSPTRFQRVPQSQPRPREPEEFVKPETESSRAPSFAGGLVSVVEGDSGGRRNYWMTPSRPKTTPAVTIISIPETTSPKVGGTSSKSSETKSTVDYVTIRPETKELSVIPNKEKSAKENMIEVETRHNANSELDDGQSFPEEEDANDSRPPIAAFLDTKSFVYSLALICASVVFFAALLTGMFIYRKKRRRLPGVHKKGGRFFFKTGAKNRMGPISRQHEERILPDDFRVTVC